MKEATILDGIYTAGQTSLERQEEGDQAVVVCVAIPGATSSLPLLSANKKEKSASYTGPPPRKEHSGKGIERPNCTRMRIK